MTFRASKCPPGQASPQHMRKEAVDMIDKRRPAGQGLPSQIRKIICRPCCTSLQSTRMRSATTFRSRLRCVVIGVIGSRWGESQSALTDVSQGVEGEHRNRENQFVDLHRARWQPFDIHISLLLACPMVVIQDSSDWKGEDTKGNVVKCLTDMAVQQNLY